MANKIVQLQDEDGNAVFPVAGGIASGAVTTSSILDGAVTASKIDFTSMPVVYGSSGQSTGNPSVTLTSKVAGTLIASVAGRVTDAGDVTITVSSTNTTNAVGGRGANNATTYGQVTAPLYFAQIPANTTTTVTATFSKTGDWRWLTAIIIPFTS